MIQLEGLGGTTRAMICGSLAFLIVALTEAPGWSALRGPRANVVNDYVERGARSPDMTSDEYNTAVRMRDQKKSAARVQDYIERGARSPDMTSTEYDRASKVREESARAKRVQNYIATGGYTPDMTDADVNAGRKVREQSASAKRIADYVATGGVSPQMTSTEYETAKRAREQTANRRSLSDDYVERGELPAGTIPSQDMFEARQAKLKSGAAQKGGAVTIGPIAGSSSGFGGGSVALLEQTQSRYADAGSSGGAIYPVDVRAPANTSKSGSRAKSGSSSARQFSAAQIKAIYAKNGD